MAEEARGHVVRQVAVVEQMADAREPLAAHGARVVLQGGGVGVVLDGVGPPADQSSI